MPSLREELKVEKSQIAQEKRTLRVIRRESSKEVFIETIGKKGGCQCRALGEKAQQSSTSGGI